MARRREIDGLRAIAVGAVILNHAGVPLVGGFTGVDVFFVLSGYLITLIILRETAKGTFSLVDFWVRRARRILPALAVMLAVVGAVAFAVAPPAELERFGRALAATALFSSNIELWRTTHYFAPSTATLPLLHTWSLAVEEQFYLAYPLVLGALLWLCRRRPAALVAVLAAACVAGLAFAEVMARITPVAAFYLTPARAWELLAGAVAAAMVARHGLPRRGGAGPWHRLATVGGPLALVGLGLVGLGLALTEPLAALPGVVLLPTVVGTVLVLLFAVEGTAAHRLLTLRPLVWLGLVSYSAYLWHQPLFAFARTRLDEAPTAATMAALTALTVVLAALSHRFVEEPFRRPRDPAGARAVYGASAAALATFAALGLVGWLSGGLPQRLSAEQVALLDSATASPRREECTFQQPYDRAAETACRYGEGPVTTIVYGDSHSVELAMALGDDLAARGEALVQLSASGCPPALTFTPADPRVAGCRRFTENALRYALESPASTVVIAFRHAVYLYGDHAPTYPTLPDRAWRLSAAPDAEARAAYWDSLSTIVARLEAAGKTVRLVEPVPEIGRPIAQYILARGPREGRLATVSRADYDARNREVLARLTALGAPLLPVAASLCDAETCYGALQGTALYFDDDHLSLAGARLLVRNWQGATTLAGLR